MCCGRRTQRWGQASRVPRPGSSRSLTATTSRPPAVAQGPSPSVPASLLLPVHPHLPRAAVLMAQTLSVTPAHLSITTLCTANTLITVEAPCGQNLAVFLTPWALAQRNPKEDQAVGKRDQVRMPPRGSEAHTPEPPHVPSFLDLPPLGLHIQAKDSCPNPSGRPPYFFSLAQGAQNKGKLGRKLEQTGTH